MDRISTPSTAPSFLRFLPCFMDEPVARPGSVQPSRAQNRFPTFQRVTTSTVSRWRSLTTDWGKHDGKGRREDRKNTTKTVTQHGSHREAEAFKIKRLSCKIVTPLFGTRDQRDCSSLQSLFSCRFSGKTSAGRGESSGVVRGREVFLPRRKRNTSAHTSASVIMSQSVNADAPLARELPTVVKSSKKKIPACQPVGFSYIFI